LRLQDSGLRDANAGIDRQLVLSVASGSAEALARLYDRHAPTVFALARRMLAALDAAEGVVQDVFTQVWREAKRYQPDRATVAGWIVMLTRARAIDRLRALKARPDQSTAVEPERLAPLPSAERSPESIAMSSEDARSVRAALGGLSDEQRSLVALAFYDGLSHSKIADRIGLPLGTVKTRVRAAIATLRSALT